MRVDRLAGGGIKRMVAAEEIVRGVAVVEAGGDDEVDRLLAKVAEGATGPMLY